MSDRPLILVSGCYDSRGSEFGDASLSLSNCYAAAVVAAGGLPIVLPVSGRPKEATDYVSRVDGILLTGGEDLYPEQYCSELPLAVAESIRPGSRNRDELEIAVAREAIAGRKPLLAICRGHQLLNVAFGGRLVADIPLEMPAAICHRDGELGCRLTHEITVESGSVAAELFGRVKVKVNSSHHQAVATAADGLLATAHTADGVVEVMELPDHGLPFGVSVQFHPERNQDQNPGYRFLFQRFVRASAG
jgi:putative glutamine amidotransferase